MSDAKRIKYVSLRHTVLENTPRNEPLKICHSIRGPHILEKYFRLAGSSASISHLLIREIGVWIL